MTQESKPAPEEGPVLKLKTPVVLGALEVRELRFPAKLKGRHLRRYATNDRGMIDGECCLRVAADATGQPDRVMDELDAGDAARVIETVMGFFFESGVLRTSGGS